eukprot:9397383-Pyramimonas_sp.AAC.1
MGSRNISCHLMASRCDKADPAESPQKVSTCGMVFNVNGSKRSILLHHFAGPFEPITATVHLTRQRPFTQHPRDPKSYRKGAFDIDTHSLKLSSREHIATYGQLWGMSPEVFRARSPAGGEFTTPARKFTTPAREFTTPGVELIYYECLGVSCASNARVCSA